MSLKYGMNFTASDMQNLLEQNDVQQNGIRSWKRLFGGASLGHQSQSSALKSDYSEAIAQAYKSNLAQRNAALGSGLNTGATSQYLGLTNQDLHATYQNYMQNYSESLAKTTENYQKELSEIRSGLEERSNNFAKLYSSAYDYLSKELNNATGVFKGNAENGATPIYEGKGRKAKLVGYEDVVRDYIVENNLNWLRDEATGELRSWEDVSQELLNPDGSLTAKGVQFIDQMFNTTNIQTGGFTNEKGEAIRGFDQWLSDTDIDLRNWAASQDSFNYNFAGTNMGTAKALAGLNSTDNTTSAYEYATAENLKPFYEREFVAESAVKEMTNAYNRYVWGVKNGDTGQKYREVGELVTESTDKYFEEMDVDGTFNTFKKTVGTNAYNVAMDEFGKEYENKLTEIKKEITKLADAATKEGYMEKSWDPFYAVFKEANFTKVEEKLREADVLYNELLQRMETYISRDKQRNPSGL